MDDKNDERLAQRLASELGISEEDVAQLEWEIATNESSDGLIYNYVLTFDQNSPRSILDRITGLDENLAVQLDRAKRATQLLNSRKPPILRILPRQPGPPFR